MKNKKTMEPLAPFNGTSEPMVTLGKFFREQGLYTFVRWNTFFANPPLTISEDELRHGFVFHRKTHPAQMGAADISKFLTWLAVERRVSASTQNQALSALLFLYKAVLAIEIGAVPPVVRARTPERLPVVLSREEIGAILSN